MPDAPVSAPPAAPSAAPPPAPPSIAPPSPRVSLTPEAPAAAPPESKAPEVSAGADDGLKFDFGFGEETAEAPVIEGEGPDYGQPFDPAIEELLKNSPEQLKKAKAAWYDNRNWRASGFKNAQEAKQFRGDVDTVAKSLGRTDGKAGLDAIRAESQEWATTMAGFKSGDEGVIKGWMDMLEPAASEKVIGQALGHFQSKNPQGWSRTMAQSFMGELRAQNARGESILTALNRLAAAAKDPDQVAMLRSIADQVNQIDEISRQTPAAPGKGADSSEREQIASEKRGIFVEKLSMRVMPTVNGAAAKAAKTVLGSRTLGSEAMKGFTSEVSAEYARLAKADAEFQQNAKDLLAANDVDGFERLTKSQIRKIMPTAARNVNRKYSGFSGGEQRRAEGDSRVESAAGGSQAGGKMRYSGKMVQGGPDPSIIDWSRMRQVAGGRKQAEDMMFDHRFFVKGDSKSEYYW